MRNCIYLSFFSFCCTASAGDIDGCTRQLEILAAKNVESRKSIASYYISATFASIEYDANSTNNNYKYEYKVWHSSDGKYRIDKNVVLSATKTEISQRHIHCYNCERDKYRLVASVGPHYISGLDFESLGKQGGIDYDKIWWAFLGFVDGPLISYSKFPVPHQAEIIAGGMRKHPKNLVDCIVTVNGSDTEYQMKYQNEATYRIISSNRHGDSCILYESSVKSQDIAITQSTRIDYFDKQIAGQWFPKIVTHSISRGNVIIRSEEIRIDDVRINQDVDPLVFTLQGMNLPEGMPINLPEIKQMSEQPTWRNGKIDHSNKVVDQVLAAHAALGTKFNPPVPDQPPSFWSRSWPYLVGAAVFAALGFFLLRKMRKPAD